MKKTVFYLILFLSISCMTSCSPPARYDDSFYNVNYDDYPLIHLPLIKPIRVDREVGSSPWRVLSPNGPWVSVPDGPDNFFYVYAIEELEKFAIKNGVIMAYSAYVDTEADAYIQDNYYHWFVLIPDKQIAEGFHTEDEFNQYIQTLGVQDPDWRTPDEAYEQFSQTGCLEWISDCNQR
jgi:hypothetical protein